jgi:enolase
MAAEIAAVAASFFTFIGHSLRSVTPVPMINTRHGGRCSGFVVARRRDASGGTLGEQLNMP